MPASSGTVSPPGSVAAAGVAVGFAEGCADDVGFGDDCSMSEDCGTSVRGATVEFIGSYGRLVRNSAMNVANAAAPITLAATKPSLNPGLTPRVIRRASRD